MKLARVHNVVPLRRHAPLEETLTDAALVGACAAGDPSALAALYDRHVVVVARFLGRFVHVDASDVDDLVQDTFLAVLKGAPRFREGATVRTWILAIAANTAKEHARSSGRRRAFLGRLIERIVPSARQPDADLALRRETDHVAATVARLPHDLRVAFLMCDIEEVPCTEAAGVLGIPVGTLYGRLHHARRTLREALGTLMEVER